MRPHFQNITFLVMLLITKVGSSQQDPMYSMYMFDKMLINPAFTGSSNWAVGTLKYREQFVGMNGHPKTQTFNFHGPIQRKHIGVGFKIVSDKMGIMSNFNTTMALSYHLGFAGGKLSLGLEGGVYTKKINYQKLILNSLDDKVLPPTQRGSSVPDVSFGIYYQKKQFYGGISNYHLIRARFDHNTPSQAHLYKHIYVIAGNVFDFNKHWSVEPSLLLKYQPSSAIQLDLNAMVYYSDRIGAGMQMRTGDGLACMLRYHITENFKVAYSYDFTFSGLSPASRGSHELIISYGIKLPPPPSKKEIHPRYYF
jgi:type IX secretion system PorP/SprF family membrane protein